MEGRKLAGIAILAALAAGCAAETASEDPPENDGERSERLDQSAESVGAVLDVETTRSKVLLTLEVQPTGIK
jgi:hypothetical protein